MRWATVGRTQAWPREPSHPTHAPLSRTVIQAIKEKYKERGETTTPQEGHDSQRFCVHPFDGHTLRSSVTADGGGYRQQWRPGLLGKSCYFMKQCVHILFVLAFFFLTSGYVTAQRSLSTCVGEAVYRECFWDGVVCKSKTLGTELSLSWRISDRQWLIATGRIDSRHTEGLCDLSHCSL